MGTPKPIQDLRRKTLMGNSPGTPLRRSFAPTSASPQIQERSIQIDNINDDEAERRSSRRYEPSESGTNLTEAADSLNSCLKLFAENKISKDNAWTLNIIDSFSKLIKRHHHSLSNFQVAGSTLEASAKVYSLRVDSVYTDVMRMSADLSRQTAKALTKKNRLNLEENEESEKENEGNINDENNDDATDKSPKQRQKAKKRRQVSTITKNPETLNARLDTFPLVDPFFAKLNSMVGDINSSKRLMQNIIPTIDSNLKLRQNVKFWDLKETVNIDLNEQQDYHKSRDESDIVTVTSVSGSIANTVIRNDLKDYRICEMPLETEEDADKSAHANDDFQELFNASTVGRNASHFELQFDINAAVEPIPTERSFVMDFGDMDDNDFEDLNDEAMAAVNKCKGLKRQPVVIEDMQPETAVHLEYSYRPLDNIDQFWAGPSHWKFRQSRRHCSSVGTRASQATAVNSNTSVPPVRKVARKKKIIAKSEVLLEDLMDFDEDNDVIISITRKANRQQVSTQTITKRWDSKKLRLPIDFKLVNDIFDRFIHASTIQISSNPDATFTGNDDGMPYDYDNENDRNYCSRIAESQSDTETETNTDIGQMDNNDNVDFGNIEMPPPPVPADEIPDIYVGAPERIEKISIAYAKRAKIIDMKQLKICSWNLISTKNTSDPFHNPCFSETLKDLPKVLNKTMAENMSMPLAFYAMLHLCNDKSLILKSNENLRDFEICFPK